MVPDIVICNPLRTPIGNFQGALRSVPVTELGASVIRAVVEQSGIDKHAIDGVVLGQVIQAGARMNPARQAAIGGGLPVEVPAMAVNRVCGSGAQAVLSAAQSIASGEGELFLAGGMENMDRAPYLMANGRWGYRMGHAELYDSMLMDGLYDAFSGMHSGWHTEDLVAEYGISRKEQDGWAERSHRRFVAARKAGHFARELVAVEVTDAKGRQTPFVKDEAPRPDTSMEALARLRAAFREDGTITAGNSPGLNSGASVMIVARERVAKRLGLTPMAKLSGFGVTAVQPGRFGLGPVPAVRKAVQQAGWSLDQVDRFEINEAYAAIALIVSRELGLDLSRVNVDGGAVAHGHPIGATGAVLITRLLHAMWRTGGRKGVVSLCIGGGQGIALALEVLAA